MYDKQTFKTLVDLTSGEEDVAVTVETTIERETDFVEGQWQTSYDTEIEHIFDDNGEDFGEVDITDASYEGILKLARHNSIWD